MWEDPESGAGNSPSRTAGATRFYRVALNPANPCQNQTAPVGWEHPHDSNGNPPIPTESGAKSGAPDTPKPANAPVSYPDLAEVAKAWPTLPAAIRAGILAMATSSNTPAASATRSPICLEKLESRPATSRTRFLTWSSTGNILTLAAFWGWCPGRAYPLNRAKRVLRRRESEHRRRRTMPDAPPGPAKTKFLSGYQESQNALQT